MKLKSFDLDVFLGNIIGLTLKEQLTELEIMINKLIVAYFEAIKTLFEDFLLDCLEELVNLYNTLKLVK